MEEIKANIGTDTYSTNITCLSKIKGQEQAVNLLQTSINGYFYSRSLAKGVSPPAYGPLILVGPSGCGKSMLAEAVHASLGNANLINCIGETLNDTATLFSTLINATDETTIFCDECHSLNSTAINYLLKCLTDKALTIPKGKTAKTSCHIPLPSITYIFATDMEYKLPIAFRNRQRVYARLELYSVSSLIEILRQKIHMLHWQVESEKVLKVIAERSKNSPRQAIHTNLQMARDVCTGQGRDIITLQDTYDAFSLLQIDELGLDKIEQQYLHILYEQGVMPVGNISCQLSLPVQTIQRCIEPFIFRENLAFKNKVSHRVISDKGRLHIENSRT